MSISVNVFLVTISLSAATAAPLVFLLYGVHLNESVFYVAFIVICVAAAFNRKGYRQYLHPAFLIAAYVCSMFIIGALAFDFEEIYVVVPNNYIGIYSELDMRAYVTSIYIAMMSFFCFPWLLQEIKKNSRCVNGYYEDVVGGSCHVSVMKCITYTPLIFILLFFFKLNMSMRLFSA